MNWPKELVDDTEQRELNNNVYLFDNWYLASLLTNGIEFYKKDWISELGSNRTLFVNNRWYNILEFIKTIPASAYRNIKIKKEMDRSKSIGSLAK